MPSLEDVYCKFGFASEAAQLLETELGTLLFREGALDEGLFDRPNAERAADLVRSINRKTLGQLIKHLNRGNESVEELETLLKRALSERNRLSHSFYRLHNFRRNSNDGRLLMLKDLEDIHESILEAYKAVMRLSRINLDEVDVAPLPEKHVPL